MDTTAAIAKPRPLQDLWSELSTAALYLSEITWATVIFCTLFNQSLSFLKIGLWFVLLGFSTFALARLIAAYTIKRWVLPVFGLIWLVITLFLFTRFIIYTTSSPNMWHMLIDPFLNLSKQPVLQSQLWQMLFLILLLRRGLTLAGTSSNSWRAIRSFQVGMLMFFFFGFTTTWENYLPSLAPFLIYLLCILAALITSRLASLSSQLNYRFPVFTKTWFAWIFALTLSLILFGSSIGWLTGVGSLAVTDWVLSVIFGIGVTLLVILFSPLIALIGLILPWLDSLLKLLNLRQFGLYQLEFLQKINQPDPEKAAQVNNTINLLVTILLITILVIIFVLVIVGVRRRALKRAANGRDDLVNQILERKLKRVPGFNPGFLRSRLEQARRWLAAARIRRVYQQLMTYCAKLDNPRLPAFTPNEFLPQLTALFPDFSAEVTMLTDVYQRVRYGEVPESLEELQAILSTWNVVKVDAEARVKDRRRRLANK